MNLLSLSAATMLPRDAVVGVFDLDTATVSGHTREFLRRAQAAGNVIAVGEELPQSFVVASEKICAGEKVFAGERNCGANAFVGESAQNCICLSPQSSANLSKKLLTRP